MRLAVWAMAIVVCVTAQVGCGSAPGPPTALTPVSEAVTEYPMPEPLLTSAHYRPLPSRWTIVDNPVLSADGWSLAVHAAYLTDAQVSFYYSLEGTTATELYAATTLRLSNQGGDCCELRELWPLATLDGLELGVIRFARRPAGSSELYITAVARSSEAQVAEALVAELRGPEGRDSRGTISKATHVGALDHAGSRIRATIGGGKRGTPRPPATREPSSVARTATIEPVVDLPDGVRVLNTDALEIEGIKDGQRHRLVVQTLSNGGVVARLDDTVSQPEPVPTPLPTFPGPYPAGDETDTPTE